MKKLLTTLSQKWPEYLLEILVLIIGIYGAFALERWGENKRNREIEKELLLNFKQSLKQDLEDLNINLTYHIKAQIAQKTVMDFIDTNDVYDGTIDSCFHQIAYATLFVPSLGTYEQLKSVGTETISNDSILSKIFYIYDLQYGGLKNTHEAYISQWEVFVNEIQAPHFRDYQFFEVISPLDINALRSDQSYRYHIGKLYGLNNFLLNQIQTSIDDANQLTDMIEKELQTKFATK